MAGKKGRSGRYKAADPNLVNKVGSLSIRAVIAFLENPDNSELDKAKIALPIAAKRLPDISKVEIDDKNALPLEEKKKLIALLAGAALARRRDTSNTISLPE